MIENKLKLQYDRSFSDKEIHILKGLSISFDEESILWASQQLLNENRKNKLTIFSNRETFKKYQEKNRIILEDWVSKLGQKVQIELKLSHDIIMDYYFDFTYNRQYNHELLEKLWYFKSKHGILFSTQIEIFKRNHNGDINITITELLRKFEPIEMFIEQSRLIKELFQKFISNFKGMSYDEVIGDRIDEN